MRSGIGIQRSWNGDGEQPPIKFTRFLDGDEHNFTADNCIEVSPYEWFSAPDGHGWCVTFAQAFSAQGGADDISLTGEEVAFVVNNFEALATFFAQGEDVPGKQCPHCKTVYAPKYTTFEEAKTTEPGSIWVEQHMTGFCSDKCWDEALDC